MINKLRFKYQGNRLNNTMENVIGLTFANTGEVAVTTESGDIYSITQDNDNLTKLYIVDINNRLVPADKLFRVLGCN